MHVLLISATAFEIDATTKRIEAADPVLEGLDIEVLVGGVGMVSTAYVLTKKIGQSKPAVVIQAGIAGGLQAEQLGKVYAITEDRFADLGVTEENAFKSFFDLRLAEENQFPFQHGCLVNPYRELLSLTSLPLATALSVNEITTDHRKLKFFQQNFPLAVESMEGAACHYVCLQEQIPFLQIRAVSNKIGERDKSKWQIKDSLEKLNAALLEIFEKLNGEYEIEPGF